MLPSDSKIFGSSFNHPAVALAFSDEKFVQQLLAVEAALAAVLAQHELIPVEAAAQIEAAAAAWRPDFERLRLGTEQAGLPVSELVRQLREQVGEPNERYVHWGATSQDILDTGRVLQVREALEAMQADLARLIDALAELCQRHRRLLMPGRTHAQQALPITFGYKVATWLAPLLRHRQRLTELRPRVLVLQFGGAVGTLAAYGDRGQALYAALAERLGLGLAALPWHAQRDGFAELAGWFSLLSGSLAKMAQDIILLSQSEVGELRETADAQRGGSSTMPQKRNPIQSELVVAAARANAALLSGMHQALIQEHERGTHGQQLEWVCLPQMVALTGAALAKSLAIAGELAVEPERMRHNLESSQGTLLAEAIRLALLEHMPAEQAASLVRQSSLIAIAEARPLVEVVRERSEAELDWDRLADESQVLGATQWFIDRVLAEARG